VSDILSQRSTDAARLSPILLTNTSARLSQLGAPARYCREKTRSPLGRKWSAGPWPTDLKRHIPVAGSATVSQVARRPGGDTSYARRRNANLSVASVSEWEDAMLVVRFKVRCQPDKTEEMVTAMKAVVGAARTLPGVVHFDIGRDVADSNSLIATEVFEDRPAMEREESIPEVAAVVRLMEAGALAGPPEWTIFDVASSESPSM
jgi:quinol monooxygenase YgiN